MNPCRLILLLFFTLAVGTGYSQTPATPQDCPAGFVCITPEAARRALVDSDTVKAQSVEIAAKDTAIADLQKELNAMRIELAKAIGEKTGSEQMVVRLTAIIDFMLKNGRTKKYGLINF